MYPPTTEHVRARYTWTRDRDAQTEAIQADAFDRWLAERDADHETAVRERIAQDITRELGDGRAADIARRGA